jgi:cupin 2 domain-containing protein
VAALYLANPEQPDHEETVRGLAADRDPRNKAPYTMKNNLFENIPKDLPDELFETLVKTGSVHIERIVSRGHTSPEEGWYEQEENEFVLVLKGAARLEFEDGRVVSLGVGDWLEILAGVRHRVVWTDPEGETIWVGMHY